MSRRNVAGTPPSMRDIARERFLYGSATIDLRILRDFALDPASPDFKAPPNAFSGGRGGRV